MRRWWFIAILLLPGIGVGAMAGTLARAMHPGLARTENELSAIRERLKELPKLPFNSTSSRLGFHTATMDSAEEPVVFQLDLGGAFPVERIALVPVGVPSGQGVEDAYGFPRRLRVEASLEATFAEPMMVAEWQAQGGRYPVLIELERSLARHVRITINGHWPLAGQWVSALGEIMVFSAGRNVALQRSVQMVEGRSVAVPPAWNVDNLTDGESLLGAPVNGVPSPTIGFRSGDTNGQPWVQVDLGQSIRLDEIRLIPARFLAEADTPGYGFPSRFRVLAGYDARFGEHEALFDQTSADLPNPGDNPFVLPVGGRQFRFLRIVADKLWSRGGETAFALSELQVFSGAKNVSLHAEVTASGETSVGSDWAPKHLTDGFGSTYQLIDRIEQLKLLAERQKLELRMDDLEQLRQRQSAQALTSVIVGGGGLVLLLLLVIAGLRLRHRRAAHRATQVLRTQIAGDLHDDVGSNLGSIALVAQAGARQSEMASAAEKFGEIEQTARETAESMRDIVWLLKAGNSNTRELLQQMRAVAARGENVEFNQRGDRGEVSLPLDFTRQVFLIFKEALANARKHSRAERINVDVELGMREVALEVADTGEGFDPSAAPIGNGLGNLRDRAGSINAELVIESVVGKGARVKLRATLPRT